MMEEGYTCSECADELLKKDREVVLAAVQQDAYALHYVDELLRKDREFMLAAVKRNGHALHYALSLIHI